MKFYGPPNIYVRINNNNLKRILGIKGLSFDEHGEYVTDNEHLIRALKSEFEYKEEEVPVSDKAEESNNDPEEVKSFTCKVCNESFDNKGKFLAHTRTHKKGE